MGGQMPCMPRPAERPCAWCINVTRGDVPVPARGAGGRPLHWLRSPVTTPGCVEERGVAGATFSAFSVQG